LSQIERQRFDPQYIFDRFRFELEPLASDIASKKNKVTSKWDFEQKIYELIRSDQSTQQGHMAIFILNSPYYYDSTTQLFHSGMSSVWNNLLKNTLYGFPTFLNLLNKQFDFNYVIYELIKKYAPKSFQIHKEIETDDLGLGYSYHTLNRKQIETITGETYQIYCLVQRFLQNLSQEQKNWIDLIEKYYCEEAGTYNTSYDVLEQCQRLYLNKYGLTHPMIDFNNI